MNQNSEHLETIERYNELVSDYNKLLKAYNKLQVKHNELVDEHNELVDEYEGQEALARNARTLFASTLHSLLTSSRTTLKVVEAHGMRSPEIESRNLAVWVRYNTLVEMRKNDADLWRRVKTRIAVEAAEEVWGLQKMPAL